MQAKEESFSEEEEEVEEDFDWIYDENCPEEMKKEFLKFPLEKWGKILFGPDFDSKSTILPGDNYKSKVNRILGYYVFNNFEFLDQKRELINFNLYELLDKWSYMMSFNYKINKNKKYISIIGIIKKSYYYQSYRNFSEDKDYLSFIKKAYSKDEELLLMYIYDESYKLIVKDINKKEKFPLIICYIPKLYVEEVKKNFREINNELRFNLKNNGLKDLSKQLISIKEKIKENERYIKFSFFINVILLLIISYLIFLLKN